MLPIDDSTRQGRLDWISVTKLCGQYQPKAETNVASSSTVSDKERQSCLPADTRKYGAFFVQQTTFRTSTIPPVAV